MTQTIALWCAAFCFFAEASVGFYGVATKDGLSGKLGALLGAAIHAFSLYGVLSALGWAL